MNDSQIIKSLSEYSQKIQPLLETYLKQKIKEAKEVGNINAKLLEKFLQLAEKGKKVRGMLVVLGYQIAGGKDIDSIYNASIFIELLQAGALIHDDIMDQDDFRRGIPTIHKQFEHYGKENGKSLAMLAGDMAFYLSWDKLIHSNFSADRLVKVGKIYAKYALNTTYGQALDLINHLNTEFNDKDILNVFRYKTAEYTGVLPLLAGATLGELDDKKKLSALKEYGLDLGWSFQIQDDILGLYGNQEKTGKPLGTDLREGKRTLLVHYIFKYGNSKQLKYLRKLLGNKKLTPDDIKKAQFFFKEAGAYDYVIKLGWNYVAKGKAVISTITSDKNLKSQLNSFIEFIMQRTR